jgi:hypothetical protein
LHKRLIVLEHLELATATDESSVFWDSADTSYLVYIRDIESLNAAIVENAPNFNHALGICCDKTVQGAKTVNADERLLVTVELHYFLFKVRIPNENFKVKTTRHYDLVLFTVGDFSNCLVVTRQSLYWLFGIVF